MILPYMTKINQNKEITGISIIDLESTGRSLQTRAECQAWWERGWVARGRARGRHDVGSSLPNCSFLPAAPCAQHCSEQPLSRTSQTSLLLLLYQHFDKAACWYSWTECFHEVPLSVLRKVTAFLCCGISIWTFKAHCKEYLGSTWESLLFPALLLCHVCIAGPLMRSAMSHTLVCRVKHSKMINFDWVMTRGLWLKKILQLFISCQGEKSHIILDYAYFIIKLYKWAIKLRPILPSLCFID